MTRLGGWFTPLLLGLALPGLTVAQTERGGTLFTVRGKTEPAPGHLATIAPQVQEPVSEVLVREGDTVRPDQVLVRHDDDEAKSAVRSRQAALDDAKAQLAQLIAEPRQHRIDEAGADLEKSHLAVRDAERRLQQLEPLFQRGAVPERTYQEARSTLAAAQKDQKAAQERWEAQRKEPVSQQAASLRAKIRTATADLESARAQLDNYVIKARIGGVVTWIRTNPGLVARPGTAVWGEILDPSELDVRCQLSPEQADRAARGQAVRILDSSGKAELARGTVTSVGIAADPDSGMVPVIARVPNPARRLRCHVSVVVAFSTDRQEAAANGRGDRSP